MNQRFNRREPAVGQSQPKKPSTITTDTGRIERHIIPLLGTRRVKDLTKTDINKVLKDIMAGKTRVSVKTKKLRGKAIVRGGAGTATRTVGLLGGILTYAVEQPGTWHPQAKGQRAEASAIGGGVSNTRSDAPRRCQAGEICHDGGHRSSVSADRLPA
jgi:hypothetical protein